MLTKPDPNAECTWALITTETTRGKTSSTVEWCVDRATAEQLAAEALTSATEDGYAIQIFVVQLAKVGRTNADGALVDRNDMVLA